MKYDNLNMLPEQAFKQLGKRMTYEGGKGSAPKTPDYTAAANATAAGNLEAAKVAAAANRVNQVTPYGNLTYTQNPNTGSTFDQAGYDAAMARYNQAQSQPAYNANTYTAPFAQAAFGNLSSNGANGTSASGLIAPNRADYTHGGSGYDTYTATTSLSPAEQAKLEANNNLELGLLGTAQKGLNGVDQYLSKGFDFNALPAQAVNAGQTAQDAIMARLNPQFQQSEDALRTRLVNQGVRPGSQAWDNEFRDFNQGKNDAYSQAALQGISVGQQARQQALQEQEFGRTEGLNMVNALRTGNQVQNPTFTNTPQQATTAGPDLLGAANANYQGQLGAYNAQQAAGNGLLGGLATIGGSILGGPIGGAAANYFLKK